jgi:hypothetical protein
VPVLQREEAMKDDAVVAQIARLTEHLETMIAEGKPVEVKPGVWVKPERVTDPDTGATTYRLTRVKP